MGYSLGIGLTNACNLDCPHCYRDTEHIHFISLEQVQTICELIPIDAVGMGTGENALNPEFAAIVQYLQGRGIKLSIASNGYSLTTIPAHILRAFHDVEVSIDFPSQKQQDAFRGEGNWTLVHRAIERCHQNGVEVSILATLMQVNYQQMDAMVRIARRNEVNLRVNAYQAVKTDQFRLCYEAFWEGYTRLFAEGQVVSCSEPVVRAVLGFQDVQSPCGRHSLRINPLGQITPCVYWPVSNGAAPTIMALKQRGEGVLADPLFRESCSVPSTANGCACQGGCASRRALSGNLNAHDDYCPWVRGERMHIDWRAAPAKDLMRSSNVCTTVVV